MPVGGRFKWGILNASCGGNWEKNIRLNSRNGKSLNRSTSFGRALGGGIGNLYSESRRSVPTDKEPRLKVSKKNS